jgi:superfamily II DNA or RNA helicase
MPLLGKVLAPFSSASRNLELPGQEHVAEGALKGKFTYVVPDEEHDHWQAKYPDALFLRESHVPEGKRLGSTASLGEIAGRLLSGPKFVQKKELVEMPKAAEVITPLLPHQQRVVDRMRDPNQSGLVVAHGLGSGKTLTSIAVQDALGMPASVVLPAALQANYEKERAKHLSGEMQPIDMTTLQAVARRGKAPVAPMLIIDEAHRIRDASTKGSKAMLKAEAEKRLALTATPFYNAASDVAPLINFAAGQRVLPNDPREFYGKYVQEVPVNPTWWGRTFRGETPGLAEKVNPKTAPELRAAFGKYMDYHPSSAEGFPSVERRDVKIHMTPEQLKVYDTMLEAAPPWVAAKIKSGLPPSKQESKDLNAFMGAVRQVSNTTAAYAPEESPHQPKIEAAFHNLQRHLGENERAKAVVYSNYLDSGLKPYAGMLDQAKVPYGMFTGEMKQRDRDQMVHDYNEGKLRALLLSSAGGEGLDLKGTRVMQVLDPHWNEEKLHQVEGRGVRYGSHTDLPEEERKVMIERYLATRPRSGLLEKMHLKDPGGGVDEYLANLSGEKERLHEQFRQLIPGYEKTAGSVFHGSSLKLQTLQPRHEHGLAGIGSVVFASPSRDFALAYAGNRWTNEDIRQGVVDGKRGDVMRLEEMRPGAFKDAFDTPGYLYRISDRGFTAVSKDGTPEVVSSKAVKPTQATHLRNVLKELKRSEDIELRSFREKTANLSMMPSVLTEGLANRVLLRGALPGAFMGGALGAGVGGYQDKENRVRGAITGGAVGALTGGAVGTLHQGARAGAEQFFRSKANRNLRMAHSYNTEVDRIHDELNDRGRAILDLSDAWKAKRGGRFTNEDLDALHNMYNELAVLREQARPKVEVVFDAAGKQYAKQKSNIARSYGFSGPSNPAVSAVLGGGAGALAARKKKTEQKTEQKTAALWHLLAGPVGHIAVNAAGRAAHHGSNLAEFMAHRGFQHGASGSAIAPLAARAVKAIAGPESTATYELARKAGKALYDMPPAHRQQVMQGLSAGGQLVHPAMQHLRESPVLGDILRAVQHDVSGTVPQLKSKGFLAKMYSSAVDRMTRPTQTPFDSTGRKIVQNVVGGAPLAAMYASDSLGSAAHFGFNTAREVLAKSSLGRHVMDQNFKKGLGGVPMSTGKQLLYDIGASPAFLDPYRVGLSANKAGFGEAALRQVGDIPLAHLPAIVKGRANAFVGPQSNLLSHILPPGVGAPALIQKVASSYSTAKDGEHKLKIAELAEDGEHKLQGRLTFQGLPIAVENKKGSIRSGTTPDGHHWKTKMKATYGYLEAPAKGKDGEGIDVYVGPDKKAPNAYVVHQHKPDGTGHDEDKIILGVKSEEEAKKLFLKHCDDPKFLGPVSEVPIEELKKKIETSDRIEKISEAFRLFWGIEKTSAVVQLGSRLTTKVKVPESMLQSVDPAAAKVREEKGDHYITLIRPEEVKRLRRQGHDAAFIRQVFSSVPKSDMTVKNEPFTYDTNHTLFHVLPVSWPKAQEARAQFGLKETPLHVTVGISPKQDTEIQWSMKFPKREHASLRGRLAEDKPIYTTRVSSERNKYRPGMLIKTPWGDKLKVETVEPIAKLKNHPFYGELSDMNKKELGGKKMDLVKLVKAAK